MKLNKSAFKRKFFYVASGIFSLWLASCDTYQNVSYYDRDGIYSDFNKNNTESVTTAPTSSSNQYKDYFSSLQNKAPKGEILTDVEQYRSENYTDNDTTLVYTQSYSDWGSNASQTNVNFYGNNWGLGWNNYWGWNSGWNWNIGLGWGWNSWYNPYYNWGWNSWYYPYNYYGWGWNSWCTNYGYGNYYQPVYHGIRSYAHSNLAPHNYSYNGVRSNHNFSNNSGTRTTNSGVRIQQGYSSGNIRQNTNQTPRVYNIRTPNTSYNQSNNPRPDYGSTRASSSDSPRYNAPRYNNNTSTRSNSGYSTGSYGGGNYSGGSYGGGRSSGGRR